MALKKKNVIRHALVVGATSSLAYALCQAIAKKNWNILLAGRDEEELSHLRNDLIIRYGVKAETIQLDLSDPAFAADPLLFENGGVGEIDTVFIVAGEMGDPALRADSYEIDRVVRVNYLSPIKIAAAFAERAEEKRKGDIVVISSVAGDRGRQSNYTYGSAKSALTAFASGLRNRLAFKGCHVMTVKPGFVDTPLTYGMKSSLIAPREQVANEIINALDKKVDVLYTPSIWRWIMLIITHIPESIFKKLKL